MRALLPVITTRRSDRRERGYLAWVAVARETAHLPLETAPIDASTHVLEIYVDGIDEPLTVLAEPMGAPNERGAFPLKLAPLDEAHAALLREELFGPSKESAETTPAPPLKPPTLRPFAPAQATSSLPPPLTTSHVAALRRTTGPVGSSTFSRRAPGQLRCRELSGGRFVLEDLLGSGASGEVYRARHTTLRRPVAVKVLHPTLQHSDDYCARFYAEALAASQLDHRNVLRILDYGQEPDGILYIVMELLDGLSLQQILDQDGPLPLPRLVSLVSQACAGLAHAHDAGVIHRDIKPENVVIVARKDDDGNISELAKVCDFGIAHWVSDDPRDKLTSIDSARITLPDATKVVGTPAYMAPEQIRNEPVDARTDVYALGVLLYELSTGRLPFENPDSTEVFRLHVTTQPTPPSKVVAGTFDSDLEAMILKALEKNPATRFPDVRAFRAALRELVDDDWATGSRPYARISSRAVPAARDFSTHPSQAFARAASGDEKALAALRDALRTAVYEGNLRLAGEIIRWLEERLDEPRLCGHERDLLERAFRGLRDPAPMRAFTNRLLSGKVEAESDAITILGFAGPVGARSLLETRKSQMPSLELRARFVRFLQATGPAALPVVLGGLESIASLASRSDEALAEDLLRAAPSVRSDVAGELALRFVLLEKPPIAVVALKAVVNFWGSRAQALLLGVLDSSIDPVRVAAVEALQQLQPIDDSAIERLGRIVLGHGLPSLELRVAAALTLSLARPEARARVVAFLEERLVPVSQNAKGSRLTKAFVSPEEGPVIVALARSFAALDPTRAALAFEAILAWRPELRVELESILDV